MPLVAKIAASHATPEVAAVVGDETACAAVIPRLLDVRPPSECESALGVLLDEPAGASPVYPGPAIAIEGRSLKGPKAMSAVTDLSTGSANAKAICVCQTAGEALTPILDVIFRTVVIVRASKALRRLHALASTGTMAIATIAVGR
jgi:hypothetical protein